MSEDPTTKPQRLRKIAQAGGKLNRNAQLVTVLRRLRDALPGDSRFGDALSLGGEKQSDLLGRRLAELTEERPGVLREAGLSALQVWQAISEAQGRGRGDDQLAILFTDLVEFSTWVVDAGDEQALALLRDVGEAIEPPVRERRGRVVKRLGDGMMAVFADPADAVEAVIVARRNLEQVEAPGYRPEIRAGVHFGCPRQIGGDYLGVDVNVAARITEQAGGGELLVSDRVVEELEEDSMDVRRKRLFRAKGVPKDLVVYAIEPAS